MRLIVDTCSFLWIILDSPELSEKARIFFSDTKNEVYLSVVSVWEIIVKNKIGRLPLPDRPFCFIQEQKEKHGISSLPLDEKSVSQLASLPDIHRDPFDRMIVCQAIAHDMVILTPDVMIKKYPAVSVW